MTSAASIGDRKKGLFVTAAALAAMALISAANAAPIPAGLKHSSDFNARFSADAISRRASFIKEEQEELYSRAGAVDAASDAAFDVLDTAPAFSETFKTMPIDAVYAKSSGSHVPPPSEFVKTARMKEIYSKGTGTYDYAPISPAWLDTQLHNGVRSLPGQHGSVRLKIPPALHPPTPASTLQLSVSRILRSGKNYESFRSPTPAHAVIDEASLQRKGSGEAFKRTRGDSESSNEVKELEHVQEQPVAKKSKVQHLIAEPDASHVSSASGADHARPDSPGSPDSVLTTIDSPRHSSPAANQDIEHQHLKTHDATGSADKLEQPKATHSSHQLVSTHAQVQIQQDLQAKHVVTTDPDRATPRVGLMGPPKPVSSVPAAPTGRKSHLSSLDQYRRTTLLQTMKFRTLTTEQRRQLVELQWEDLFGSRSPPAKDTRIRVTPEEKDVYFTHLFGP